MLKVAIEPLIKKEYYLLNYNNLKTNIPYLRLFAEQIQNHYNFIRLHRNLKFNNRLFHPIFKNRQISLNLTI